jgi:hypothetical protein
VPLLELVEAAARRDRDQRGRAGDIAREYPCAAEHQEQQAAASRQPQQLAEKQRDHDRGLERLHSAASLVHADEAVVQLNDIAELVSADARPAHDFHRSRCDGAGEPLDYRVLELHQPRHRDERKR